MATFDLGIKESKFQILPLPLITQAAVEDKHTPYVTMCLQGLNQIFSVECLGWNQTHVSAQETVLIMEMLLCTFIFSTGKSEGFISVRTKYFQKVKSDHAWHASFNSPRTFSIFDRFQVLHRVCKTPPALALAWFLRRLLAQSSSHTTYCCLCRSSGMLPSQLLGPGHSLCLHMCMAGFFMSFSSCWIIASSATSLLTSRSP